MLAMAITNLGIVVENVDHIRFGLKKRRGRCKVISGLGLDGPYPVNNERVNFSRTLKVSFNSLFNPKHLNISNLSLNS